MYTTIGLFTMFLGIFGLTLFFLYLGWGLAHKFINDQKEVTVVHEFFLPVKKRHNPYRYGEHNKNYRDIIPSIFWITLIISLLSVFLWPVTWIGTIAAITLYKLREQKRKEKQ